VPPPKTTAAQPPGTTVPGGKVWRTVTASASVQPEMSIGPAVALTSSTNSSSVALTTPSPFASPWVFDGSAWISLITKVIPK